MNLLRRLLTQRQDQAIALLVPVMGLWAAADVLGIEDSTMRCRAQRLGLLPAAGALPDADAGLGGTSEPPTAIGALRGLKPPSSGHPQQRDLP